MFMYTAKFSKKTAVLSVLVLAAILCAIILLVGSAWSKSAPAANLTQTVRGNDARVSFLRSLGWEVDSDPVDEQTIVIPREFDGVYEKYNEIQLQQGFDLTKYGGIEAVRYTYKVNNYPGTDDPVVADIVVYRNKVIAGDVQSTALDGFMQGLEYPKV